MIYRYSIEHSNGSASGTIEAPSQERAREILVKQYIPEHHGFVERKNPDADWTAVAEHKLINLDLEEV